MTNGTPGGRLGTPGGGGVGVVYTPAHRFLPREHIMAEPTKDEVFASVVLVVTVVVGVGLLWGVVLWRLWGGT